LADTRNGCLRRPWNTKRSTGVEGKTMIEDVLTWVGALLGATMLIVMALGSLVLDYTDLRGGRTQRTDTPTR